MLREGRLKRIKSYISPSNGNQSSGILNKFCCELVDEVEIPFSLCNRLQNVRYRPSGGRTDGFAGHITIRVSDGRPNRSGERAVRACPPAGSTGRPSGTFQEPTMWNDHSVSLTATQRYDDEGRGTITTITSSGKLSHRQMVDLAAGLLFGIAEAVELLDRQGGGTGLVEDVHKRFNEIVQVNRQEKKS